MYKINFPIFESNPGLVYLDTGATAQKPKSVIDAVSNFYSNSNANIHRGLYPLSEQATEMYDEGRKAVADFVGAETKEIIFTRGATEAINLVRYTWAEENLREGDTVLVTVMEHHSNFVPWYDLAERKGVHLKVVDLNDADSVSADDVIAELDKTVKLVCVVHVSNGLGVELDVKKISEAAHEIGARVLVDAAQSVVHMPVDVKDLDCDFLAFSGHKLYGPTGIGALYVRSGLLEDVRPFNFGGDMIKRVEIRNVSYMDVPERYEAGTPNIAGAVGLKAAIEYLNEIGMKNIREHDEALCRYAISKLKELDFVEIAGPEGGRVSAVSFVVDSVHPHDVAQILSDEGVCVRAGHHCTQPLNDALGYPATVRFSFGIYNDEGDIDKAIEALKKVKQVFG